METMYQSAHTPQTSVPPQENEDSPLVLAKRLLRYMELHVVAGDIVRKDPELMKEISQRLQAEGKEVPLGSPAIPDLHQALLFYDSKIDETPTTFLDHYYRFHYTASAIMNLIAIVIGPRSSRDPAFFKEYSKTLAKIVRESKIMTPDRPASATNASWQLSKADRAAKRSRITPEQAKEKLRVPIGILKNSRFYTDGGGDPDEAGEWKITRCISRENDEDEYRLRFDGVKTLVSYTRAELIELLTRSVQFR